jgi:5'-3' exonuclease
MTRWLLVDGRNLLWRAAQANDSLSVKIKRRTILTGGIYGFLMSLLAVHQRYGGKVIVAWEGRNNFRFDLFKGYKPRVVTKEREAWVESLDDQQSRLQIILARAGVYQYAGEGCEADDVMATLAATRKGKVIIYTMDSDLRQCVNRRVQVVSAGFKGDTTYEEAQVLKRHGVKPSQIADLKALMGDHSDGIPGVRGIGEKTAAKLLQAHESLSQVIKSAIAWSHWKGGREGVHLETWPVAIRFAKAIADDVATLKLYQRLTTVLTDAKLREIPPRKNRDRLASKLMKYGIRTLAYEGRIDALLALGGK